MQSVQSFNQIPFEELASPDICVLFDLDDTTFIESLAILRNINFEERKKFVESIRSVQGNERVTFLYDNLKYQLIEDCLLNKLQIPGLQCLGFTARRTGKATSDQINSVEDSTLRILSKLGVQFKNDLIKDVEFPDMHQANETYKEYVVDSRFRPFDEPQGVMIKNGVVFCNNLDKGLVLKTIFDKFKVDFKTICLIDNEMKNHQTMIEATKKLEGINYIGYHYTGANLLNNTLDFDIIGIQKQALLDNPPQLLNDDEAQKLK